ncbi:NAD(P)H-dependent oxidoreductase [Heliorestis convoluta]|uniref:NADPH-dependent FMN reductase-like domain-containing protein n=1 Tax=Heliorestis convoluta TaxID=356322 RepID=A0A5Q2N4I9_9FIRM|nr:NAD(P)H-dependent oxidoreductase [Heliorestis convoluta]QGG48843.1 hypothetical protein FTV88_2754 [Heliorestis convoluta]
MMSTKRTQQHMVIIAGSTRKKKTSFRFAEAIQKSTEAAGHSATLYHVVDLFEQEGKVEELKKSIAESHTLCLVAPVYTDTLPYPTLWLLEKLASEAPDLLEDKKFFALGQCGFPDVTRCEPLLETCRFFALTTKMRWMGGLGYGGGSLINGVAFESLGSKGKKLLSAMEIAAQDVLADRMISEKAQKLLQGQIPTLLIRPLCTLLNYQIKKEAKQKGVTDLFAKPYQR